MISVVDVASVMIVSAIVELVVVMLVVDKPTVVTGAMNVDGVTDVGFQVMSVRSVYE